LKLLPLKKNFLILGKFWGLSAVLGKFSDLAVVSAANSVVVS